MVSLLLVIGLLVAVFVGFNIGGSSTGVAFGPAVGSDVVGKTAAAALMSGFALLGGWTAGRHVIKTMGGDIVPSKEFTLVVSVAVLLFVGLALLISNTFGVPASTSMTAVGAIVGLGAATHTLKGARLDALFHIVSWWIVAPILAFWICAVIGRYIYPYLDARFPIDHSGEPVILFDPMPRVAPGATIWEVLGTILIVAIGCFMAFSAGASNAANAVAPLVGGGQLSIDTGILLAGAAIALGAFTIARRTLDTVGNDLTDLPILAALIVEIVSASIISGLSIAGIPASLAVSATMSIVGLGWGRATRTVRLEDAVHGQKPEISVNALAAESHEVRPVGEPDDELLARDLFDPSVTGRVIFFWVLTPAISAIASYTLFTVAPF